MRPFFFFVLVLLGFCRICRLFFLVSFAVWLFGSGSRRLFGLGCYSSTGCTGRPSVEGALGRHSWCDAQLVVIQLRFTRYYCWGFLSVFFGRTFSRFWGRLLLVQVRVCAAVCVSGGLVFGRALAYQRCFPLLSLAWAHVFLFGFKSGREIPCGCSSPDTSRSAVCRWRSIELCRLVPVFCFPG